MLGWTEKAIKIRRQQGQAAGGVLDTDHPIAQAEDGHSVYASICILDQKGLGRSGPGIESLLIIADDGLPVNNLFQTEDNRWRANVRR